MLGSQLQVLLLGLCWSVVLDRVDGAPRGGGDDMLTEALREELAGDKDVSRLLLLNYMSDRAAARGEELLRELEEEEEAAAAAAAAAAGGREEVRRRHLPLSQRERKAGCRNFFWKTFTSC
ncbi:somatostatin-1 [Salarias fasciatus]|uniref:somatostatin-1 n=1 Tax=Salarias fasciatus TaxID=181472 RepID=UPI001176CCB7|nr:somatostatin-1-like [Salarias fasciatus]